MALFTDTRELDRQGTNREFNRITGWRKTALSVLGYKSDGTKNGFGKTIGTGNILTDHYIPKWIAGKNSDVGQVIDSAEGEEWNKQIATAKLAAEVITLGAASGAGSAASAAGVGASTTGATAGTAAKVGAIGAVPDGTKAIGASGKEIMSQAEENVAKNASMDALNSSYSEQTINGVTTTSVNGMDLSEEDMANWQKYMQDNPEGTIEDFKAIQDAEQKGEGLMKAAEKTKGIPLVGNLMDAIAARPAINNQLRSAKRGITDQQNLQTFNYL